jgi:predicted TPR repeat methyltransferase
MKHAMVTASRVAAGAIAAGGRQNFLGAPWVSAIVRATPAHLRPQVALFLLSLSPHYFFATDRHAEAERNRKSREALVSDLLDPFLDGTVVAMDYGCGAGYMAAAVSRRVMRLEAVDISRGVLACAEALNGADNLIYETPNEASRRREHVDLIYSFAVVQHLSDETFRSVMSLFRRRLRPGGTLALHFVEPGDGWRTEAEWRADTSFKGRAKLRFALNCFGRESREVEFLVTEAGFSHATTEPLASKTDADPDLSRQHWLLASG